MNCGRASHSNEKQGTAALFASQKPGLSAMVPDSAIKLTGSSVHRSDRTKELTGNSRGGGVCFYINNSWCDERNLHSIKSFCSPDLEFHMLHMLPKKTIHIYPNQKPWINSNVRSALSARTSALKSGNTDDQKQASYDLRRSIKAAKRQYKNKVEEQFNTNNTRSMCHQQI